MLSTMLSALSADFWRHDLTESSQLLEANVVIYSHF